jgi:hypothetical protein
LNTSNIEFPDFVSPEAVDLIRKLTEKDPKFRIGCGKEGVSEIMNHPFFSEINFQAIFHKEIKSPIEINEHVRDIEPS